MRAKGVGTRIRRLRKRLGWTQAELAGNRLSKSYISQIETGRVKPSEQALSYIAGRLGRTPKALLQDENVQPKIRSLISMVQVCLRRRETGEAAARLREAAEMAMNIDDPLPLGQVHECAGHLYVTTGRYDEAAAAFREAIATFQSTESLDRIAATHCSLANVLALQGKIDAAQDEVKAAQDIYSQGLEPDHLVLGRSYLVSGNIAVASGRHEAAQRLFRQAISLLRNRDIIGTGETHAALGISLLRRGDPSGAVESLHEAQRLLDEVSDPPGLAVIARFLAEAYAASGEPKQSVAAALRAGNLASQFGDRLAVGWAAVRLAELALVMGDNEMARDAAAEAGQLLELRQDAQEENQPDPYRAPVPAECRRDWGPVLRARLACVRSVLARSVGQEEESLSELKAASRLLSGVPGAVPLLVVVCRDLAARLRSAGRLEEALECSWEALDAIGRCDTPADPTLNPLELAAMPSPLWFRT